MSHGANPDLAAKCWRQARRLFGARADDFAVRPEQPALLLARSLRGDGMPEADAVVVACDVIPEANASEVLAMLRGEPVDAISREDPIETLTGQPRS